MGGLCPLALCRPDPPIPHSRLPLCGLPPLNPSPKVASLQKTLGSPLTSTLPPDSLPLLLFSPTRVLRAPPWRRHYDGAVWAHPFPLVSPRADSGMHVFLVVLCGVCGVLVCYYARARVVCPAIRLLYSEGWSSSVLPSLRSAA